MYFFAVNYNTSIKNDAEAAEIVKRKGKGLFHYSGKDGFFMITYKTPVGIRHTYIQARDGKGNVLTGLGQVAAMPDDDLFFFGTDNEVVKKETLKKVINGEFAVGGKRKSRKSRRNRKNRTRRH